MAGSSPPTKQASFVRRNDVNKSSYLKDRKERVVQNFLLIWLDASFCESNADCQNSISQLRKVVNSISTFTDEKECYNFIAQIKNEQIFLIVSGSLGQTFVPKIHTFSSVDCIYIFCGRPELHKDWSNQWKKIRDVSNNIKRICQSLVKDACQCENDLIPTSILSLTDSQSQNLEKIDQSFMYSQLLKEILVEMKYDEIALDIFTDFCRKQFSHNEAELKVINEFKQNYYRHSPIWWYTRECFVYQMVNRSLRTLDIDIIAMMGFVMKDIDNQIKQMYSNRTNFREIFKVYRGQGMFHKEFDQMRNNIGGLMAFSNFLSTSMDADTAKTFTENSIGRTNKVPVLFHMKIDPALTSTPFASLDGVSYYEKENEILFSMHTIFRIVEVKQNNQYIWDVKLKSVNDNDLQITRLTEQIRRDIGGGPSIDRLGQLMIHIGEFEKAEVVYDYLLESTSKKDEATEARIRSRLGYIKYKQNLPLDAELSFCIAHEIQEKLSPKFDLDLATTYCYRGLLHTSKGDLQTALSYHSKALTIQEKHLNKNHQDLATTYNNIGLVCDELGDYSTALDFYSKALQIYQQNLPSNHPWLATSYKNIGLTQSSMEDYTTALDNLNKAREIRIASLPPSHPSIASIFSAIGQVYRQMRNYSAALSYYRKVLEIEKRTATTPKPTLAMAYYNISRVYNGLQQYDMAVKYAEQAVQAAAQCLPLNDPDTVMLEGNFERLQIKLKACGH